LTEFVPAYPNSGERDRFLRISFYADKAVIIWCICLAASPPDLKFSVDNLASWIFSDGTAANFDGTWISMRGKS